MGTVSLDARALKATRRRWQLGTVLCTLFLGLLLEGFFLAPRGMGAIPAIATEADIDDLAAAIGRALAAIEPVREPANA